MIFRSTPDHLNTELQAFFLLKMLQKEDFMYGIHSKYPLDTDSSSDPKNSYCSSHDIFSENYNCSSRNYEFEDNNCVHSSQIVTILLIFGMSSNF